MASVPERCPSVRKLPFNGYASYGAKMYPAP